MENLKLIASQPRALLDSATDCFGNALDNGDEVLRALRDGDADELFLDIVKSLAKIFYEVLDRQLQSYSSGELSEITPELAHKTSSAPLHNMHSERALGMFDAHCSRARNATAGFVDGKVKYKLNNTSVWLESKTFSQLKVIVAFARHHGARKRKSLSMREKRIQQAFALKQKLMSQKRDLKKRKTLEKAIERDRTLESVQDLTPDTRRLGRLLYEHGNSFVGQTLFHVWEKDHSDQEFTGIVTKANDTYLWIKYDGHEAVTKFKISALITDIHFNDARFSLQF